MGTFNDKCEKEDCGRIRKGGDFFREMQGVR